MAFDYTTVQSIIDYGRISNAAPAEQTLVGTLVTEVSRQVDQYCSQVFYQQTYAQQVLRAQIDIDGVLCCHPAVPTMATPTAADWKLGVSTVWTPLDVTSAGNVEIETGSSGCLVRILVPNLARYRGSRIQIRLSYTGGWADLAAVPGDFELAVRRAVWWEYKKRDAPMEKTANPQLGIVVIPSSWPPDLREKFRPYVRQIPI